MENKVKPEQILEQIVQSGTVAVVNDKERKVKMVEQGKRIPNIVLRKTADKLRAKGVTDDEILERLLFFDEMAEKGQLLEYLKEQKKGGK